MESEEHDSAGNGERRILRGHPLTTTNPDPSAAVNASVKEAKETLKELFDCEIKSVSGRLSNSLKSEEGMRNLAFEVVKTRFNGMDRAVEVLEKTTEKIPSEIQIQVGHLQNVLMEKFGSIDTQFAERDVRTNQDRQAAKEYAAAISLAAKEAVAAALQAAKEMVGAQQTNTEKQIGQINTIISTNNKSLTDKIDANDSTLSGKIDNLKGDLNKLENRFESSGGVRMGAKEAVTDRRDSSNLVIAAIGGVVGLVGIFLAVAVFLGAQ